MINRRYIRLRAVQAAYNYFLNETVSYNLAVDALVDDVKFHNLYFADSDVNKIKIDDVLDFFSATIKNYTSRPLTSSNPNISNIAQRHVEWYKADISKHTTILQNNIKNEISQVHNFYKLIFDILITGGKNNFAYADIFLKLLNSCGVVIELDTSYINVNISSDLLNCLYNIVLKEDATFSEYLNGYLLNTNDKSSDVKIIKHIVSNLILKDKRIVEILEKGGTNVEKYKYIVSKLFNTSIKSIANSNSGGNRSNSNNSGVSILFSVYDIENIYDLIFYDKLIMKFINERHNYDTIIKSAAKNYDVDGIDLIDKVIITLALCEINAFEDIPRNVSINEYIEVAKLYTTGYNTKFINGIIDGIISYSKEFSKLKSGIFFCY